MLNRIGFSDDDFLFVLCDAFGMGEDGIKILKWMMPEPNMELIIGGYEAMMLPGEFLFDEITVVTSQAVSWTYILNGNKMAQAYN